jgi:mono/diheme cytochrome c family protein
MVSLRTTVTAALCAGLIAAGCKGESKQTSETQAHSEPATAAAAADPGSQAHKVYKAKCVVCHGEQGAGDGPGSASLDPKPRAFASGEWQQSVTDEHLKKTIVQGGASVGKSAAMPGNPDLRSKPEVVDELVKIIRGFKS